MFSSGSSPGFTCLYIRRLLAILTVTSPIVVNVPTRGLLAVETKDSFVLWLAEFKYQRLVYKQRGLLLNLALSLSAKNPRTDPKLFFYNGSLQQLRWNISNVSVWRLEKLKRWNFWKPCQQFGKSLQAPSTRIRIQLPFIHKFHPYKIKPGFFSEFSLSRC